MTFTVGETVIASFTNNPYATMTQGFNQAQLAPKLRLEAEAGDLACDGELFFPTVEPEAMSTAPLTLRNEGNDPLLISALELSGAAVFSLESAPTEALVIPVGGYYELNLSFTPEQVADYTGMLRIEHTDVDAGPCALTLVASAVYADVPALPLPALLLLTFSLLGLSLRSIRSL